MNGSRRRLRTGRLLFGSFAALSLLLVAGFGLLIYSRDVAQFRREAARLREEHLREQKALIRSEVEKVFDFVEYNCSRTEERLRASIKARVYEAHGIATHLHRLYAPTRGAAEARRLINEALRPIRFNNGRGYFFATGLDGREILFADRPEMEGRDLLNLRNGRGVPVIREMIDLIERDGEGFYQYDWTKPQGAGREYPKIAYLKRFDPFAGFLGTGEYLDDVERDIQQEALARIGRIRYGEDGYIFVVSYDGVTLMNGVQPELIGKPMWEMTDPYGVKVIQEERRAAETPDGDFINYHWRRPTTGVISPKVSFVKGFPRWRWMIGAGVYADEVEAVIAQREAEVERRARASLGLLALMLGGLLLAALGLSFALSRHFNRQLELFLAFFKAMETGGEPIDAGRLTLHELRTLGESANAMLAMRQRAEEDLKESEERHRILFDNSRDALAIFVPPAWECARANAAMLQLFGASDLAELAWGDPSRVHPATQPDGLPSRVPAREVIEQAVRDGSHFFEWTFRRLNGETFPADVLFTRMGMGDRFFVQATVRDVSAQKRAEQEKAQLEEQLRQAQKMEAVGRLAGGVAHDFNNILTSINGYAEMLLDAAPSDSSRADLTEIQRAAQRAAALTGQLLAFSRKQIIDPRIVDLNGLIEGLGKMLGRLIGEDVEFVFRPGEGLGTVKVDPSQMEQALVNLAVNARDAMPEGGRLTIATFNAEIDQEEARRHADASPGEYVAIAVGDNGSGMDTEVLSHLFEPFFTTKERGRGTGLGLSMVYGIVRQNEGFVSVQSQVGQGTVFTLYLPRASGEAERRMRPASAELPPGRERIMVVEDEATVRHLAQRVLERQGYQVTTAGGGADAIAALERRRQPIDLLLTDVIMPEMNGRQLYELLRNRQPGLKALFMSGYAESAIARHGVLDPGTQFLQKPFTVDALVRKVREVLDL